MTTTTVATAATRADTALAARIVDGYKIYGHGPTEVHALDGVTVDFAEGEFTAIMGPSGSGKSTLMHCLAGLDQLTSGEVWLGEVELSKLSERERTRVRRDQIGFVFQAFNLVPTLSARENIVLPRKLAGASIDNPAVEEISRRFGIADRLHHRPGELSGGQQQRVAVARALFGSPRIVLADEPTGNLDSRSGAEILRFMREAVDAFNQTIVMVTHDPNAASYSDRVVFLADGKVVNDMHSPSAGLILDYLKQLGG